MSNKLAALSGWLKQILQPPHRVWKQKFEDGEAVIELRHPFIIWLLLVLFILYFFMPVRMLVICLITMLGIFISGYGWARSLADNISASRKLRYAAVQVGDELEEDILLRNIGWLPALWIGMEDHSDFPAYSIRVVRALDGFSKAEWRLKLICTQRGVFSLGPWEWISSDPFGLFHIRRSFTNTQKMIVYPPLAFILADMLPHGKEIGDLRPLNQPLVSDSMQVTHTRLYQPGDPLRRIHWGTTARQNKPYVKVFDPEATSRIWLIPDLDPEVHYTSATKSEDWQDSSEETVILLLSALASQLLNEHRAVGLFAGVNPPQVLMPQRSPAFLWNILAALAPLHTNQLLPFAETLLHANQVVSPRDLVIVVTPSLQSDWLYSLAQLTSSFSGSEAWAFILDPLSFGLPGNATQVQGLAASLGIGTRLVQHGDIQPLSGGLGALRRWEFMTLATGRVVVRNKPRLAEEWESDRVEKWQ
jgi:uncharacterized protein (DUF58 family)